MIKLLEDKGTYMIKNKRRKIVIITIISICIGMMAYFISRKAEISIRESVGIGILFIRFCIIMITGFLGEYYDIKEYNRLMDKFGYKK